MDSKLTVAADLVVELREGLRTEMGDASHRLWELTESTDKPPESKYEKQIKNILQARAALKEIGWTTPTVPVAVEVDLAVHGPVFLRALEGQLASYVERLDELRPAERLTAVKRTEGLRPLISAVKGEGGS